MKSIQSSVRQNGTPKSKVNNSPVYVELSTGSVSAKPKEGYFRFASSLEYQVWMHLKVLGLEPVPQFKVEIMPKLGAVPAIIYTPDFFIPSHGAIIECKGQWITADSRRKRDPNKADRSEFLIKWNLLNRLSRFQFTAIVGTEDFTLSREWEAVSYERLTLVNNELKVSA